MMPEDYYLTEQEQRDYERWLTENKEDLR